MIFFSEATFTKNKSTEKEKSLPKSLFMGKFNLNEETFARGLMDNDFRQVKKSDGRIEYAWGQSEHSTTRGKQSKTTLQTQAQGSRQDIAKFSKTAKSWKIGLFAQSDDPDGDGDDDGEQQPLAIQDDPGKQPLKKRNWEKAKSQMTQAIAAIKKIGGDARKILAKVDEKDDMYTNMCLACVHVSI